MLAPEGGAAGARGAALVHDRYQGVLLGVAAGNCLGLPGEGAPRDWIRQHFPGGLREIPAGAALHPWDDDLAQTVMLAEALVELDRLEPEDLAGRLLAWVEQGAHGIGYLTLAVVRELQSGAPAVEAARRVWERSGRRAAGNGAVMRCSPVALRWARSPARLIEETRRSAVVTHHDPRCVWSAIAINSVIARALAGAGTDLQAFSVALAEAGAPVEVVEAVSAAPRHALEDLALDDADAMGYTIKAMQVGLWSLSQPGDFEEVLTGVVNAGGDTDTNGAVAGAVMGARMGRTGIPARWVERIPEAERLAALADRLFERALKAHRTD